KHGATGGTAGSWFEVDLPSGLRAYYGTTDESRVQGRGGVTRAWWVAKSSDRRGNFITYGYRNDLDTDGHTREQMPSEIHYTGFDGVPAQEPSRVIRFHYQDKDPADQRTLFLRGTPVASSQRLWWIEMRGPGDALVREYRFGYTAGAATGRTRLDDVRVCA